MMKPYYCQDGVTIYLGSWHDVLPTISDKTVSVLIADPPYFRVKTDQWDRQWSNLQSYLSWLNQMLVEAKSILTANASLWVFASPRLATDVEQIVRQKFKVLNQIRWIKSAGWHRKITTEKQRRYLTPWEAIIFAEQYSDAYEDMAKALHKSVFAPIGRYIQEEREKAGLTRTQVEIALGYISRSNPKHGTALCYRWEEGASIPTGQAYQKLRQLLNTNGGNYLRKEYEELRQEYEELRQEYEELRRPFNIEDGVPVTDSWSFKPVMSYPGKHPCEKPIAMLHHMINVSSFAGNLVLDPVMGSGSTLIAAKELNRKAIGIEIEEKYCKMAIRRLQRKQLLY